jgi:hypothetical protein
MKIRRNGFLCYAHCNGESPSRKFVKELKRHLNQIQPEHGHRAWSDQDIRDGQDWPSEVGQALDQAAYAVLFVNIELLDSEFVRLVELRALLEAAQRDGLLLLALWVSPCHRPDWLARIQFSNEEETPLGVARKTTRDRAYAAVRERVAGHLIDSAGPSQAVRLMGEASPPPAPGPTSGLLGPAPEAVTTAPLDLADALSQRIAMDFEAIRERYRCGERRVAVAEVDRMLADPAWPHLDRGLRGRILRTAALYRLAGSDASEAEALAVRAAAEDPEGDAQVLETNLALHRGDTGAALALLEVPRSPQALNLKAAVLIEADDAQAALGLLGLRAEVIDAMAAAHATPPIGYEDVPETTAETWRLRALALLALKRLTDAVEAIEEARALASEWLAVRSAAAVLDFWRACTPAALALTEQPLWPMPFARALVRADASARLEELAETYAAVAEAMPADSDEQGHWLSWRLIALLSAANRRDEATDLAKHLLEDGDVIHPWPLVWARFYDLDLDRARLKRRLCAVPEDDKHFILLRGLCLELRLEDGEGDAVLDDLTKLVPIVEKQCRPDVARQWRVLALTALDRLDEATAVADSVSDGRLRLRLRLHIARRIEKDQPGRHKDAAAALFAADPEPDVLAEACESHATAGDWAFVAAHADALLDAIPTPGSLRLLAIATFNQGEYRRCLTALDEKRHVYADGRLPQDLALLRVRCQRALGDPSQAVQDARLLFDEAQTAESLVELLNAQLTAASTPGILDALRRLLLIEPADGHLLLHGARIATQIDRDLAVVLWRRAVENPIDDTQFAGQAAMLGDGLGLGSHETGPWFQRMMQLAEAGGGSIQRLHISQMPQFMREQHDTHRQWLDKFWHGEIALHLLPNTLLGPLPELLHAEPEHNGAAPDPLLQRPILIRHGARPLGFRMPSLDRRPRLILDLTALVTAQSLELLDRVERTFRPLGLHGNWHQLLRYEIEALTPPQPRHADEHTQIAQLVHSGGIALIDLTNLRPPKERLPALVGHRVAGELEWARWKAGRLLTYLPLHGPDIEQWQEAELPSPWDDVVMGPRLLLDGLLAEELIDRENHQRGLAVFPPEPESKIPVALPGWDSALLSNTTLLGQFADLGLLTALSHRFRLHVPADDWQREEQEAENRRLHIELARWVEVLIERVSMGLGEGHYQLLPAPGPQSGEGTHQDKGLSDLLSHQGEPGDLLWVDDRLVNGFPRTGTMPIVGVCEVLDLLRAQGAIKRPQRFDLMHRLRASNYRFIPLAADEILHWLRNARSESGRLIVPPQLEVLARYWAACLYQGDALQWTGNDRHGQGEIPFFVSSRSAVEKVLWTIWSDARLNLYRRRQRADWVLDHLYVGVGDIPHLGPEPSAERDMNLVGMDQAGLCFGAFQVIFERIGRDRNRNDQEKEQGKRAEEHALNASEDYLRWITERVVAPRCRADPQSLAPTATAFRSLLLGSFSREDDEFLPLIGSWLMRFLPVLPSDLRVELQKDQDLMQRLGLKQVRFIEIDGLRFRGRDLWSAVQLALRGGIPPILRDMDVDEPMTLRLVSDPDTGHPLLELANSRSKPIGRHYFERSEMLLDTRERRLRALRSNPHWWDGASGDCEAVERELAAIASPELRMHRVERLGATSADSHYLELEAQWQRDKGLRIDRCFPPPLLAVLTYVRCTEGGVGGTSLPGQCWEVLVQSVPSNRGFVESLRRVALLPCPLPDGVYEHIANLDAETLRDLLQRSSLALADPIGRLHLIDLLLAAVGILPETLDLVQQQIHYLATSRFAEDVELTRVLVDLGYRAFGTEAEEDGIEPRRQLLAAWVHAGRVAGILLRGGAKPGRLATELHQWAPFPYRNLYAVGTEPTRDLAWSWHVEVSDLLFVSLGRILSRYPGLVTQLDLSALRGHLTRLQSGSPDPAGDVRLLRDPGLLTDTVGCLWGGDRSTHLSALVGPEHASHYSRSAFTGLVDTLLDGLSTEPGRLDHWQFLWLTVRDATLPAPAPAPAPAAERLDGILAGLDMDAMLASVPLLLIPLMDLAVRHRSDREAVAAQIYRWADGVDSGDQPLPGFREQFGAEPRKDFGERLMNWLHDLATRHPDDPDTEFARLLDGVVFRSRFLAEELRDPLTTITRRLPFSGHRALRRTLLAARARPALPGVPRAR